MTETGYSSSTSTVYTIPRGNSVYTQAHSKSLVLNGTDQYASHVDNEALDFDEDVVKGGATYKNGFVIPSDKPGFGIEVDL